MRRRFLVATALVALAPRGAFAVGVRRLSILSISAPETQERFGPILKALAERGWRRGSNLEVAFHEVDPANFAASLDAQARAAVEARPDAILTISTQATSALRRYTSSIPIVTSVADPVGSGYAASLRSPGGNVTGLSQGFEVGAIKGVEALRVLVPALRRLAIFRADGATSRHLGRQLSDAARTQAIEPHEFVVEDERGLQAGFEAARRASTQAVCWIVTTVDARRAAGEAIRRRLPLVAIGSEGVEVGLLATFSTSISDLPERLADVAARVLSGEAPAVIPFELPREFNIALNLRTARAIGVAVPADLRVRANRVVE